MAVFLVSFIVIVLAVSGLAVGVLFGRSGIAGTCGGLNTVSGGSSGCDRCGCRAADRGKNTTA